MLQQLLDEVLDESVPVSKLLRKAKILSVRMNKNDILHWIEKELGGYGKKEEVPEYRVIRGQVKAWNPVHGWVPVVSTSKEMEEAITERGTSQSVVEIEDILKNSDESSYEMPFSDDLAQKILGPSEMRTKVSLFVSRSSIVGILSAVRNKLFDWLLAMEKDKENVPMSVGYEGYDEESRILRFLGKRIELSKNNRETDATLLMSTLSKDPKRYWHNDELYEDWKLLEQDVTEKKAYNAARKINMIVQAETGIDDFLDYGTSKCRINVKYIKVDE